MHDDARHRGPEPARDRTSAAEGRRRSLERAFVAMRESLDQVAAAERAVTDYCRDRHREGAGPSEVIIELKRIAQPILRDDYRRRLDPVITSCIRHYYGDVEIELPR